MFCSGGKSKRQLGNAAELPLGMLVAADSRLYSQGSGEQLRPFETRLQAIFECGARAIFPRRGPATKCEGHGRTTTGHSGKPEAVIQYAGKTLQLPITLYHGSDVVEQKYSAYQKSTGRKDILGSGVHARTPHRLGGM